MDKFDWHGMAEEFGKSAYEIVRSEEKIHGFCRISKNNIMEMVGVKNGIHEQMFKFGTQQYIYPNNLINENGDDWSPTEKDEYTFISYKRFNAIKVKKYIEKNMDIMIELKP